MTDQRNLILAIVLSIAILLGFQLLYEGPRVQQRQAAQQAQQQSEQMAGVPSSSTSAPPAAGGQDMAKDRTQLIAEQFAAGQRVKIDTPSLHGSVNLVGGRLDDLTLATYHETIDPASPEVVLLSPAASESPYYAEFGWIAEGQAAAAPGPDARWTLASPATLTPDSPLTLTWDNGQGLVFERVISVDREFLLTVSQKVRNAGTTAAHLLPYGLVSRHGTPKIAGNYLQHEGPLGVLEGRLVEEKYADLKTAGTVSRKSVGGWIGITDKYWLVSLIPDSQDEVNARFLHTTRGPQDRYQVDVMAPAVDVAPGATAQTTTRLFAGAKLVHLLDAYADRFNITNFDKAIDFGWFYYITRPFFYALDFLARLFGNFGVAILVFTVIVKAAFYPLANRSYQAMSKMKALQPEMQKLRERFDDDKTRMNQELMALYKREQVNPVAGCLPILIQIPVFFALYKVLFVTIEMRQAPFFGWIHDLSVADPTTVFNLFGVIPWTPPSMLQLGAWPLIMGVTMWLQQKLNPAPPDPVQQKVFAFLPIMFTFMLASFPAGLVIYWAWNNFLSIIQQWSIMRQTAAAGRSKAKAA
jgi:YidC/Oxa1 family membrane protein insertase